MICKNCGTESREDFCPYCGEPLRSGAAPSYSMSPRTQAPPTEGKKPREKAVDSKSEKKPEFRQERASQKRKPPLRVKMVVWQAIALFLPLAYFFFDAFVLLSDKLFLSAASSETLFQKLIERLTNAAYETNSVGEIAESVIGEVAVYRTISPFSLFTDLAAGETELAPFLLPVIVTLLFSLLCAALGVFLFLTAGRILRLRLFCNLTLLGGVGATFSPLIGLLLLRVYHSFDGGLSAADAAMQQVLPSLEALMLMGFLACTLLPAIASLKRLSAYAKCESDFVVFPYHPLTKISFGFSKAIALLAAALGVGVVAVGFFLPITAWGSLGDFATIQQNLIADFNDLVVMGGALFSGNGGGLDFTAIADMLLRLIYLLQIPLLLLCFLPLLLSLVRLIGAKEDVLAKKKRSRKALRATGARMRCLMLVPYICFAVAYGVLALLLLLTSPIAMHLDFSNVGDTLSVVYLIMGYIRSLGGVTTLYTFLVAVGSLLWHTAGQASTALVVRANGEQSE